MQSRVLANRRTHVTALPMRTKRKREIKTGNGLLQVLQPPVSDQTLLNPQLGADLNWALSLRFS